MANDRFSGTHGVWGTRKVLRDGAEVPVVCVLGGSRITQIYPGTGAVILENRKEFVELLREQHKMATPPSEREDEELPSVNLGGLTPKKGKKKKKKRH